MKWLIINEYSNINELIFIFHEIQVAQQQEAPLAHLCGVSKPPSAPPRPPEVHAPAQRPRRRLPSVPSAGPGSSGARSRFSPRPSDMSDPSDSSLETESFLRDTESVVSAMQVHQSLLLLSLFVLLLLALFLLLVLFFYYSYLYY